MAELCKICDNKHSTQDIHSVLFYLEWPMHELITITIKNHYFGINNADQKSFRVDQIKHEIDG